jgi:tetratricopeptide (TPR) repeat protein
MGNQPKAREFYEKAIAEHNDGTALAYYKGLALARLGRGEAAEETFSDLVQAGQTQLQQEATLDYFATSLPTFLILEDDLQRRNEIDSRLMMGLGQLGLGDDAAARREFETVLTLDINHLAAHTHLATMQSV